MAAGKKGLAGPKTTWAAFFAIIAVPSLLTMVLSGLWHGAGDQYLVFGLLHGVALVINHAWRLLRPRIWPDTQHYHRVFTPFAWALTFLVVMAALTWFHAASVAAGTRIVIGLVGVHGMTGPVSTAFGAPWATELITIYAWIALLLSIALVPPNILEILRPWQPAITMPATAAFGRIDPWRGLGQRLALSFSPLWALATAALMVVGVLGLNRLSEFLYWQF